MSICHHVPTPIVGNYGQRMFSVTGWSPGYGPGGAGQGSATPALGVEGCAVSGDVQIL